MISSLTSAKNSYQRLNTVRKDSAVRRDATSASDHVVNQSLVSTNHYQFAISICKQTNITAYFSSSFISAIPFVSLLQEQKRFGPKPSHMFIFDQKKDDTSFALSIAYFVVAFEWICSCKYGSNKTKMLMFTFGPLPFYKKYADTFSTSSTSLVKLIKRIHLYYKTKTSKGIIVFKNYHWCVAKCCIRLWFKKCWFIYLYLFLAGSL